MRLLHSSYDRRVWPPVQPAAARRSCRPASRPPDYVVTMEETFADRKGSNTTVVTRHGEWTRSRSALSVTPPETAYYRPGSNAYVH